MNEVGRFEVRTGGFGGRRPRCKYMAAVTTGSSSSSSGSTTFQEEQVAQEVVEENLGTAKAIIHRAYTGRHYLHEWRQVALDRLQGEWVPQVNVSLKPLHFRVQPYLVYTKNNLPVAGAKTKSKWSDPNYYHPRFGPGLNYEVEPRHRLVIGLWRCSETPVPTSVAAASPVRVSIPSRPFLDNAAQSRPTPPPSRPVALPIDVRGDEDDDEDDWIDDHDLDDTVTTADMTCSLDSLPEDLDRPLAVLLPTETAAMTTTPVATVPTEAEPLEDTDDQATDSLLETAQVDQVTMIDKAAESLETAQADEVNMEDTTQATDSSLETAQVDQVTIEGNTTNATDSVETTQKDQVAMEDTATEATKSLEAARRDEVTNTAVDPPSEIEPIASPRQKADILPPDEGKSTTEQDEALDLDDIATSKLSIKPKYLWEEAPANAQLDFCEALPGYMTVDKDDLESIQGTLATMDMTIATQENSSVGWSFASADNARNLRGILARM